MSHLGSFAPPQIALLSDWLTETGELYVDVYLPHSGGSGNSYFLHSMLDLRALIDQQTRPELCVTVFHHTPYPLRGTTNEKLLELALKQIPDGQWYSIVSLDHYFPSPCIYLGSGNSHREFRTEFAEFIGDHVAIGRDPFDSLDDNWLFAHPDEVFTLQVSRIHAGTRTILTNLPYYEPYVVNPEKYDWVEALWKNTR